MHNPIIFKNLSSFTIGSDSLPPIKNFEENIKKLEFKPCSKNQKLSIGFQNISKEIDRMMFQQGELTLMRFTKEEKKPAAQHVNDIYEELLRQEMKQHPDVEVLPKAVTSQLRQSAIELALKDTYPTRTTVYFIVDRHNKRVIINTTSGPILDNILMLLDRATESNYCVNPEFSSLQCTAGMTENFKHQRETDELFFGNSIEMKGGSGQKIVFKNSYLFDEHIHHYSDIAQVTQLGMQHNKGFDFVLTDKGLIKSFKDVEGVAPDVDDCETLESALMEMLDFYGELYNVILDDTAEWLQMAEENQLGD